MQEWMVPGDPEGTENSKKVHLSLSRRKILVLPRRERGRKNIGRDLVPKEFGPKGELKNTEEMRTV